MLEDVSLYILREYWS